MNRFISRVFLGGAICLIGQMAFAFQFEFIGIKDDVHQDMSERALKCFIAKPDEHRFSCEGGDFTDTPSSFEGSVNGLNKVTTADIREAVTWPDDPVRELRKRKIHKVILWTFRLIGDKCKSYRGGLQDGLRCTSHYGDLQFMHSMENQENESPAETQKAILDWINYAYEVAVNEKSNTGYHNKTDYCKYFKADNPTKFQKAMMPKNLDGSYQFPCNQNDDTPWRLATPFALSCWWGSVVCSEYSFENNYIVRKAALGAILHAVQDSYAKGHTSRGNDTSDAINAYECAPIKQFQLYTLQNHDAHAKADKHPKPGSSCINSSNGIDDPITASAEVIRLFYKKAKPNELREYLANHVFKLAEDAAKAGTTELFEIKL